MQVRLAHLWVNFWVVLQGKESSHELCDRNIIWNVVKQKSKANLSYGWNEAPQLPPQPCWHPPAPTLGGRSRTFHVECDDQALPSGHCPALHWLHTYNGSSLQCYQCKTSGLWSGHIPWVWHPAVLTHWERVLSKTWSAWIFRPISFLPVSELQRPCWSSASSLASSPAQQNGETSLKNQNIQVCEIPRASPLHNGPAVN